MPEPCLTTTTSMVGYSLCSCVCSAPCLYCVLLPVRFICWQRWDWHYVRKAEEARLVYAFNKELQEWAILLLYCSLRSFLLLRSFVSSQKKNGKMQKELDERCVRETWPEQEASTQWGSRLLTRPFFLLLHRLPTWHETCRRVYVPYHFVHDPLDVHILSETVMAGLT